MKQFHQMRHCKGDDWPVRAIAENWSPLVLLFTPMDLLLSHRKGLGSLSNGRTSISRSRIGVGNGFTRPTAGS